MLFRNDDFFEIPFRPPYEFISAATFLVCSISSILLPIGLKIPPEPGQVIAAVLFIIAVWQFSKGFSKHQELASLKKGGVEFMDSSEIKKKYEEAKAKKKFWLGKGFYWDNDKVQRAHYIRNRGIEKLLPQHLSGQKEFNGAHWVHGLGKHDEGDVEPNIDILNGMVIIYGTTGSGKTRLYEVLISQAIERGEAVIFIDPKGDKDMPKIMEATCRRYGISDKYLYFHPAKPEISVRLDVLKNWNRYTEIASRIRMALPVEGKGDSFSEFAWKVVNDIVGAEIYINEKPNLFRIKNYISGGVAELAQRALEKYCESKLSKEQIKSYINNGGGQAPGAKASKLDVYISVYQNLLADQQDGVINDIVELAKHDRDHLAKMVPILTPLLTKLTTGPLRELLSPDDSDPYDNRLIADNKKIVAEGMVLCMALDSLSDSTIGSAIGSMELADLATVAGDRYNYVGEDQYVPVNIFIDEAAEVLNDSVIQLMNKGRGSLFRMYLATQTVSDLVARLGSKEKANMVMGNANTTICLRVKGTDTAEQVCKILDKVDILSIESNVSLNNSGPNALGEKSLKYTESKKKTQDYAIHPSMLLNLPPLHFFAFVSGAQGAYKCKIPIIRYDS